MARLACFTPSCGHMSGPEHNEAEEVEIEEGEIPGEWRKEEVCCSPVGGERGPLLMLVKQ